MPARSGRLQAVFNAGELGGRFTARPELKYFGAGCALASNVELLPQGGFSLRDGLRHVGDTAIDATRLIPFTANNGNVYDLALTPAVAEVWGADAKLHEFDLANVYDGVSELADLLWAQDLDTLLLFHENRAPYRLLHKDATDWTTGSAPLTDIPTYDYGAVYTNGVAAEFELDFIGFNVGTPKADDIVFIVTVNGQDTVGVRSVSTAPPTGTVPDMTAIAANIEAAVLDLPNVAAGATCVMTEDANPYRCKIVMGGADNLAGEWTVSARVVNKSDAAILANKLVEGVQPGEAIISNARGWPRCGCFYQQRLLMGGLKSLPNAWMASQSGRFFDFDKRLNTADGSFVVPMNMPGGSRIENIVDNQFLLIFTSQLNYWIAGSSTGLSKTVPPKHVPAGDHGAAAHVQVIQNEGAAIYIHKSGDFVGETRYTDIDGNYVSQDISLLGYHLVDNVKDLAVRRKQGTQSANRAAIRNADGTLRFIYLLREQELTGFARVESDATFQAVAVNGDNQMTVIAERPRLSGATRTIERFEEGLLLDGAVTRTFELASSIVTGLQMHEGQEVWAIADGDVFGPFTVSGGTINLPKGAIEVTVGRWKPPIVTTLPIPRQIGEFVWLQKKARIHSVQIFIEDTTSLALGCNGRPVKNVDLHKYGAAADVAELDAGVTGLITVRGFEGYVDEPQLTITQTRPGKLTVKSVVLEASI